VNAIGLGLEAFASSVVSGYAGVFASFGGGLAAFVAVNLPSLFVAPGGVYGDLLIAVLLDGHVYILVP
jgi:hypothetical protein